MLRNTFISKKHAKENGAVLLMRLMHGACSLLLFILFFSAKTYPQHAADILYQSANGRLSKQGAAFLKSHFVQHTEPCLSIAVVGGWVWRCTYGDGFAVYNCFRKCRGTVEAARLFLGLNDTEDCDSFILLNGKRKQVCYPRQAAEMVRNHGAVTAVEIIRGWP